MLSYDFVVKAARVDSVLLTPDWKSERWVTCFQRLCPGRRAKQPLTHVRAKLSVLVAEYGDFDDQAPQILGPSLAYKANYRFAFESTPQLNSQAAWSCHR